MKRWMILLAVALLSVPSMAWAQYRDLDAAMAGLERGFGRGETQPIIEGLGASDQVRLEFPGLVSDSGFFGRDQASYFLDELFNKARPSGFRQMSARKVSAEGQYHITAKWSTAAGERDLYITLRNTSDRWSIVSIRSGK